jgi:hypothetical protein
MNMQQLTPAKRKRLLKTFGSFPAGYTHDDLERFLGLLYGLFSDVFTMAELRQIQVSDPFDRSEHPRQLLLVELTDWLEALVAGDGNLRFLSACREAEGILPTEQRTAHLRLVEYADAPFFLHSSCFCLSFPLVL